MTDLEFFFDPVCPWAWITSRWVVEVQSLRSYEVRWRFISLKLINATNTADWYGDQYKRWHAMGHEALRVSVAIEGSFGNERVGDFYTAIGTQTHNMKRRDDFAASLTNVSQVILIWLFLVRAKMSVLRFSPFVPGKKTKVRFLGQSSRGSRVGQRHSHYGMPLRSWPRPLE